MDNEQNNDNNNEVSEFDRNIEKHLDIAIEAQDGKKEATGNVNAEKGADATEQGAQSKSEENKETKPADSKGGTSDDLAQRKPTDEVAEAARTLARAKDLKVRDPATGNEIVVKGGAERRFYEQRETARQERDHYKGQLEVTARKLAEIEGQYNTLKQTTESLHGVDPNTLKVGAAIVADLQRDPVGSLKKLLAEVAAQGYNVEDLGVGVDTAAITRLIDERFPKHEEQGLTDEQIIAEATREAATFYSQYPDARTHDALLAKVLRDHPGESLHSVYFQLKNSFAEKGFDWSRSLEDNLKDASDQSNNSENKQNNQQNGQTPLPNGRGSDGDFKLNNSANAHEDLDTSDLIKQAMRESGLNI